jgi:hypothetical protein
VYLGSTLQVYLREEAGALLPVMLPPGRAATAAPGTKLWVTWASTDCRFLPIVE